MPALLHCQAMPYAWGHLDAIQALTGAGVIGEPLAELWMGAHPKGPSAVGSPDGELLSTLIAADPTSQLGDAVAFGQLPFLFKVLAARTALSIQTHPSAEQARAGFAREERLGPPRDAANRTYRDANHKPELICALSPFAARVGFRPPTELLNLLDAIAEVAEVDGLWSSWRQGVEELVAQGPDADYRGMLGWLLDASDDVVTAMVATLTTGAAALERTTESADGGSRTVALGSEAGWICAVADQFPGDVGNLVAIMLNPLLLAPGEAIYLPAGNLHAYLGGVAVELMANSDNVIRCGLTSKHIDSEELLAVVSGAAVRPAIQVPAGPTHRYSTASPEFGLTRVRGDLTIEAAPAIVLVTDGDAVVTSADAGTTSLSTGQVAWLPAVDAPATIVATGTAWVATTGQPQPEGTSA